MYTLLDNLKDMTHIINVYGAMSERLMVQSWKGCVLYGTPGSNPGRSAILFLSERTFFILCMYYNLNMKHIGFIFKCLYIFISGFVLPYFFDAPIYAYMAIHFMNMIITCFCLHLIIDVPRKIRNYARCAYAIYMPVFLYSMLLLLCMVIHFEIYIVVGAALLLSLVLFIKYRKQALTPYLLLATSMPYERIKEETAQLYKQRKMENAMLVFIYFSSLLICFLLEYNMVYYNALYFHVMGYVPLVLVDIYGPIALAASIHGNESKRGKFSFKALLTMVCMSICLPIVQYGDMFALPIKTWTLQKGSAYRISALKLDYVSNVIRVKKASKNSEDEAFLKQVSLPVVPMQYEIYYVDEIENRNGAEGTTIIQKEKAQSFITNGENDDLLEIVFYHEYAHVLFDCLDSKEQLIKAFEALREENVNNTNWDEYYASTYAMESAIEDMCETYAFYMSDNKYRNNLDKHPILKKKNELIRSYLIKEYEYDYYKNK